MARRARRPYNPLTSAELDPRRWKPSRRRRQRGGANAKLLWQLCLLVVGLVVFVISLVPPAVAMLRRTLATAGDQLAALRRRM
jgi:cell division septal protein FtsQ